MSSTERTKTESDDCPVEEVPVAELERIRDAWITAGGGDLARSMEYQVLGLVAPGLLAAVESMLRSRVERRRRQADTYPEDRSTETDVNR